MPLDASSLTGPILSADALTESQVLDPVANGGRTFETNEMSEGLYWHVAQDIELHIS